MQFENKQTYLFINRHVHISFFLEARTNLVSNAFEQNIFEKISFQSKTFLILE